MRPGPAVTLALAVATTAVACRHARDPATPAAPQDVGVRQGVRQEVWDWNGIIGTGQSLSVGAEASVVTLTAQPFENLKLSLGDAGLTVPPYPADAGSLSLVPLVEPIRPEATGFPSAYPLNIYGETPHTAMGDQISALCEGHRGERYVTVHTVVGESGQGIDVIDKAAAVTAHTGHAYAASLFEVAAIERLATAAGKTYGVTAIVLTHGETDGRNENYEKQLVELYEDYNADIRSITRQERNIPILLSQQETCPGDDSNPASLIAQWRAGIDHPGEIVCVGPKYQYPYAADGLHLTAEGYDLLGEKYGEVYYERVVLRHDWQPLEPVSVGRKGKVITVNFHVPVPPLAWDDGVPAPHQAVHAPWANGRGFEVQNRTGELRIVATAIRGESVEISLADDPDPGDLVVRYAMTQDAAWSQGGRAGGRVGQLRDSDPLIGYATKRPQYNYALSFVLPVLSEP